MILMRLGGDTMKSCIQDIINMVQGRSGRNQSEGCILLSRESDMINIHVMSPFDRRSH